MALRKFRGTTIYPPASLRSRIDAIASAKERPFNYFALRFMEAGLKRYERKQANKSPRGIANGKVVQGSSS